MKIEILNIGDEVLLGQVENTNAGWIARLVSEYGFHVHQMSVIPDEEEAILESFQRAFLRSKVVLITGGLGPTHDDMTKEMLARFFDLPLVFRTDILEDIRGFFRRRQLEFVETVRVQAEFPEGAAPIRNIHGTAPGIWVEREGKVFAAMPGVPAEMRSMMTDFVLPRLLKMRRETVQLFRTYHTFGVREIQLSQELTNREEILKIAALAFLPAYGGVRMRLTVERKTEMDANLALDEAEQLLRSKLDRYILGAGEDFTLLKWIGVELKRRGMKLTVAESCTGGLISKEITDNPGSSEWFERGFVTYSNESKVEMLGVPPDLIARFGAVSGEVAEAMADGALRNSHAQVALSVTGIAGPTGGTESKPVGLVYVGFADGFTSFSRKHVFGPDRTINRQRSTAAALTLLLEQLLPAPGAQEPHLI